MERAMVINAGKASGMAATAREIESMSIFIGSSPLRSPTPSRIRQITRMMYESLRPKSAIRF